MTLPLRTLQTASQTTVTAASVIYVGSETDGEIEWPDSDSEAEADTEVDPDSGADSYE